MMSPNAVQSACYSRSCAGSVAQAVERVCAEAVARGFNVQYQHDLRSSLAKHGFMRSEYVVVEVCLPEVAFMALEADPRIGNFMPCRIGIYPSGGSVTISTIRPTRLFELLALEDADLTDSAREIERAMMEIVDQASDEA